MASFRTWYLNFLDLLSPRYCAVCGCHLSSFEQKLCSACLMGLPYVADDDFYDNPTCRKLWGEEGIGRAWSYLHYRSDALSSPLLLKLKYYRRPDLGVWAGRQMARSLLPHGFFEGVEAIVPLPLHWRRQWSRGYNQSERIAKGLSIETGLPMLVGYVKRTRNNEHQTRMSYSERVQNVERIFRLARPFPCRHILLVDDVITTGSTIKSCVKTILQGQPGLIVDVLTLGRA